MRYISLALVLFSISVSLKSFGEYVGQTQPKRIIKVYSYQSSSSGGWLEADFEGIPQKTRVFIPKKIENVCAAIASTELNSQGILSYLYGMWSEIKNKPAPAFYQSKVSLEIDASNKVVSCKIAY
jgi:hypothetical protein